MYKNPKLETRELYVKGKTHTCWNVMWSELERNNSNEMEKKIGNWRPATQLKTGQQQKHKGVK